MSDENKSKYAPSFHHYKTTPSNEQRYKRPMPKFAAFKDIEATRPKWDEGSHWDFAQTRKPEWKIGSGSNDGTWEGKKHVEWDPNDPKRDSLDNYTLMISGIVPRPIGFVSSLSADGSMNLSPFSYTNMVHHDPPVIVIGFAGGSEHPKDTLRNILETGECVVNIISENFVEAANFTCIDAPHPVSEWDLSGLHPIPSSVVKPPRVQESVFSIECKLMYHHDFYSRSTGGNTGACILLEGVRFHVREDALATDPSNGQQMIKTEVLQPVSRLGGITYSRTTQGFEIPRPMYSNLAPAEKMLIKDETARKIERR